MSLTVVFSSILSVKVHELIRIITLEVEERLLDVPQSLVFVLIPELHLYGVYHVTYVRVIVPLTCVSYQSRDVMSLV